MEKAYKDCTTNEVMQLITEPLPEGEDELKERYEIVRVNMTGGLPGTPEYQQKVDYLGRIEFKLQFLKSDKRNARMFKIAFITAMLAFLSALVAVAAVGVNLMQIQTSKQIASLDRNPIIKTTYAEGMLTIQNLSKPSVSLCGVSNDHEIIPIQRDLPSGRTEVVYISGLPGNGFSSGYLFFEIEGLDGREAYQQILGFLRTENGVRLLSASSPLSLLASCADVFLSF